MEHNRHFKFKNVMRTSLINKKVGYDHKNHAVQSVNIEVDALQINKLTLMPLINILQLSLI